MFSISPAYRFAGAGLWLLSVVAAATQPPQVAVFQTGSSAPVTEQQREQFRQSPYYSQMLEQVEQRAIDAPEQQSLGFIYFAANMSAEEAAALLELCDCTVISLSGQIRQGQRTTFINISALHRYQGTLSERIAFLEQYHRRHIEQMEGRLLLLSPNARLSLDRARQAAGSSPGSTGSADASVTDSGESHVVYNRATVVAENREHWSLTALPEVLMVQLFPAQSSAHVLQYLDRSGDLLPLTEEALEQSLQGALPPAFGISSGRVGAAVSGTAPATIFRPFMPAPQQPDEE